MPESIQELVEAAGYTENPTTAQYDRGEQHIPYADICGTVSAFREKARKHDWLTPLPAPEPIIWPYGWV